MDDLKKNKIPRISAIPDLGLATGVFGLLGMLHGGLKEVSANVNKDAQVLMKMWKYRLMREESKDASEKRYRRGLRGSFVGGVQLAIVGAGFSALQTKLAEKLGVHDVYNFAAAGAASAYKLMMLDL